MGHFVGSICYFAVVCAVPGKDVRRDCGELGSAGSYNTNYIFQRLQPQLKVCEIKCGWSAVLHYNADTYQAGHNAQSDVQWQDGGAHR